MTNQADAQIEHQPTLLTVCKLLLDADRLKILGVLAQEACSAETLAAKVGGDRLRLHLYKLTQAGLVNVQLEQGVEWFQLDDQQILSLKKIFFAHPTPPEPQSEQEKELAKFIKQEQLIQLPVNPTQLRRVLAWLADKFQPGVAYQEREVNEWLKGHQPDHVTLRRLLIDHQFLTRNHGIYQRTISQSP